METIESLKASLQEQINKNNQLKTEIEEKDIEISNLQLELQRIPQDGNEILKRQIAKQNMTIVKLEEELSDLKKQLYDNKNKEYIKLEMPYQSRSNLSVAKAFNITKYQLDQIEEQILDMKCQSNILRQEIIKSKSEIKQWKLFSKEVFHLLSDEIVDEFPKDPNHQRELLFMKITSLKKKSIQKEFKEKNYKSPQKSSKQFASKRKFNHHQIKSDQEINENNMKADFSNHVKKFDEIYEDVTQLTNITKKLKGDYQIYRALEKAKAAK